MTGYDKAIAMIEQKKDERIKELEAEVAVSNLRLQCLLRVVQRYQPAGSPPPGSEASLTEWVLSTMRQENARLREELERYKDIARAVIEADGRPFIKMASNALSNIAKEARKLFDTPEGDK